jgi:hypothetical protein
MGHKIVRFAQLGDARSHHDESIEVHEVGSKRPASGGNGGHVLSLYPLIWRSLEAPHNGQAIGAGQAAAPIHRIHHSN